ncbi:hypothetical protein MVEN_01218100 [Mycena venus]|uniref:Uncharacterized protein n=1 Tax=Mycena venus TaxID=2733690 RepID=A0A8H6Y5E4_9AGAR|nr:hypothetical protein MVEN_01218100 [Mycena venus]
MLAFGIGVTRRLAFAESLFSHKITRWLLTDIVFNLVTNIYCTGFIAYRIYTINSKVSAITRAHGGEDLVCVTAILIESSALLSAWIVFGMITYAIKSVLEIFVLNTLATVAGISFMLINVRGALGWGHTNQSITGFSVNRAYPGIPSPSMATGVRMETQVDIHVHMDMPTNSSTDDELKLGAESEDQS